MEEENYYEEYRVDIDEPVDRLSGDSDVRGNGKDQPKRIGLIGRIWNRLLSRGWNSEDHMDCIFHMGPCTECERYLKGRGFDPRFVKPISRINSLDEMHWE